MSQSKVDTKWIDEELEILDVTDEEAKKVYMSSSLKLQWAKPYHELSAEQKRTLKKLKNIQDKFKAGN